MSRPNLRGSEVAGLVLIASLFLLGGCRTESSAALKPKDPQPALVTPTPADASVLPASRQFGAGVPRCGEPLGSGSVPPDFPKFELPPGLVIAPIVAPRKESIRVDMVVPGTVKSVYAFFRRSLPRDRQLILMKDYEGFEAEIYFTSRHGTLASLDTVSIVMFCPDQALVSIEVPTGN